MKIHYSLTEKYLITLITAVTNLSGLPALKLFYMKKFMFHFYISIFTFVVSFMYHSTEFLDYDIYMTTDQWHYLDNIGSLVCINSLMIHFMNYSNYFEELNSNFISTFLILIVQTKGPFDLINTFLPITICFLLMAYNIIFNGVRNLNMKPIRKGLIIMVFGFFCFFKGLDDANDYLRLYHGLWHLLIGFSCYYIWQGRENDEHQLGYFEILKLPLDIEIDYFGKEIQIIQLKKNSKNCK